MKNRRVFSGFMILGLIVFQFGCAAPRALWPQDDISPDKFEGSPNARTVLIASRSTEFKEALVEKLSETLKSNDITLEIIGIGQLDQVNAKDYDFLLIISAAIAWGLDTDVESFLDSRDDHKNMILLTTSGEGDWLPDTSEHDFDAISSASEMADIDTVAADIIDRINTRLQKT